MEPALAPLAEREPASWSPPTGEDHRAPPLASSISSESTQPALRPNPSLVVDYLEVDAQDPLFAIGWLQSFPLFGFSRRAPEDPRYRALSKFKRIADTHGIGDLSGSDYLRALGVYAALADRKAKRKLKARAGADVNAASFDSDELPLEPPRRRWSISLPDTSLSSEPVSCAVLRRCRSEACSSASHDLDPCLTRPQFPNTNASSKRQSLSLIFSRTHHGRNADKSDAFSGATGASCKRDTSFFSLMLHGPKLRAESARDRCEPRSRIRIEHVQLLHHMLRHAESIYGLPLNVASAPALSLSNVTDRNIIVSRTGIGKKDLIVSQLTTKAFLPAHYVAIDKQIKAIVICIRGTANLIDSLTDVAATHDPLTVIKGKGSSKDELVHGYGHSGVLRSARNLFSQIRNAVLDSLARYPGYELLITGHSLGAATAAVLSLIMRDDDDFPRAIAVCIGPPPCMSLELAEETASTTITVVNGPDIVPRLSVPALLPYFTTARYVADLNMAQRFLVDIGLRRMVIDWDELMRESKTNVQELRAMHEGQRLYVPGTVLQLVRKNEVHRRDALRHRLFRTRKVEVIPVDRSHFLNVRGRERGMFLGHAPHNYRASLLAALVGMGGAPLKKMTDSHMLRNIMLLPVSRFLPDAYVPREKDINSHSLANLFDRLAGYESPAVGGCDARVT